MSFFSGLSNIFHSIGSFFDGGDDDEQKKKQQQQFNAPAPVNRAPSTPQTSQPQNNDAGAPAQPQKQDPFVNLFQLGGNTGLNKAQPKAAPQSLPGPAPPPAPPPPPKPHASVIHDITHNPITDIAGGLVKLPVQFSENYSNTFANLGNKLAGAPDETIQQNMGADPLGSHLVKWSGATGKNAQLASDAAQIGLTAVAPEVERGASSLVGRVLPDAAPSLLRKVSTGIVTGSSLGGPFNVAGEVGSGQPLTFDNLAGSYVKGGYTGAFLGGAFPTVGAGLRKFTGKMVSSMRGDSNVPAPDELATGVKSSNPTQAADAAAAHATNTPQPAAPIVDDNTPAYQRGYGSPRPSAQDLYKADQSAARKASGTAGQTYDAGLDPNNPVDAVPAFQRNNVAVPDETQGKIAEIQKQLDTMPSPEDSRSIVFELKKKYGEMLRQQPEKGPAIRQHLDAAVKAANKVSETRAKLQSQLDDLTLGTATPDIRFNMPAASEPTAPEASTPQPQPATAIPETSPAGPAVPTPSVPAEAAPPQPVAAPVEPALAPVQPPVLPESPVEPSGTPANPGIKNARFNQAVVDNAKDPIFKEAFESDPVEKDGAPLSELQDAATAKVGQMSLPELVMNYGKDYEEASPVTTPSAYYEHLQALRQLEQYEGDPTAADAAANALRAVNEYAYQHGRGLAATKVAYDNLPTSMKVAYITKLVQKAGGDLSDADLKRLYSAAELQGQFAKTASDAANAASELASKADQSDPKFNGVMKDLLAKEMTAKGELYDQNREVVDIMNKNMPPSSINDRFNQSARTMMLSSVGGRAFALTSTGANFVNYAADKTLSSLFGRVINGVNSLRGSETPGVKTSFIRPATVIKGAVKGAKGLMKETFGKAPVKDVEQAAQGRYYDNDYSHDSTRYGKLGSVTAPLRKVVRAGVGSHLALTKGVEDVELEQAARQVIKDQNIPKANQKGFIEYYKTHAPKDVAEEAKQVHLGVNNLHKNGWSDKVFGNIASGLDKIPVVGKTLRTVVMPFSRFMGGYVDKALTDRNMFYNMYRIARARSPQELSDNLARLTTNVGTGVGIGYLGAKSGLITTKDANGDSYDGLYFHIGNRYIPVAIAGQAAAPIIMGASFHNSVNSPGGVKTWPTNVVDNLTKATGVAGTFGNDSGPNTVFTGDSSKGIPEVIGTAVRQHIPGVFGDVNSGLDYSSLNPTHETALTKATTTNPATGKQVTDNVQTQINKTKATIPGVSQSLPRKAGVMAHDFLDRVLHSTQSSPGEIQKAQDDKVAADQATFDKQNDIPNPAKGAYNGTGDSYEQALQARLERGEYDKVIKSIQQDVNQQQSDKNVAPSTLNKLNNKIKQFTVAKDSKLSYEDMQLYNSTSLTDWRKMGDVNDDSYDPDTYQKLWTLDEALAKKGVAGAFLIGDAKTTPSGKQKFSAKKAGTGSSRGSRSARSRAESLVKGNTIGSTPELKSVSFGNLSPVKLDNFKIPTIQQIPADQLIKKRTISVTKA